jgi:hypothetical protein
MVRALGENPKQTLAKDALSQGAITEKTENLFDHQLSVLRQELKQLIKEEALE